MRREILTAADYSQSNVAITLKFYEAATGKNWSQKLMADELYVISKVTHHKVIEASEPNRLCIITVPHFDAADEHLSDKI